jgi:hypothetical protein
MKKVHRLPHEGVSGENVDGLEQDARPDVEGHRVPSGDRLSPGMPGTGGDQLAPGMPGTGGDQLSPGMPGTGGDRFRRPAGGGEIDDVEGHLFGHTKGERFGPGMPGTGGDSAESDDRTA